MPRLPDPAPVTAYIGLGGNLGDAAARLRAARGTIAALPGLHELACSSLYRSAPMGPPGQPDYVNAVMAIATTLSPLALLDTLQGLEAAFGRVRTGEHWGPRTLDLDILLYDEQTQDGARLTLPHPGIAGREFVLYPLLEIAPELEIPGLGPVKDLARRCPLRGLTVIDHV